MSIKTQLRHALGSNDDTTGHGANITGHGLTDPARHEPTTRHMIVMDVRKSYAGYAAGRVRLFLSDDGYFDAVQADGRGDIKIIRHARVREGHLFYDEQERDHGEQ